MPSAAAALMGALTGIPVFADVSVDPLLYGRAEVAAGYAPIGPDESREPAVSSELRPAVGVAIRSERSTFELTLSTRLYLRRPNFADVDRPLILVQSTARHLYQLSPRLAWATDGAIQVGEIEYSNTRLVTNSPISQPEGDAVLDTLDVNGSTGLAWNVTQTYTTSLRAVAEHSEPLGDDRKTNPITTGGGADASQRFTLDDRSNVSLNASYHYYSISNQPDWMSVPVGVEYSRFLSRKTTLIAGLGATAGFQAEDPVKVFPTASFAVERVVHETRVAKISNRFAATMAATYDEVLGRLYPVAGVQGSVAGTFGNDWTVTAAAFAYTAATREPVYEDGRDSNVSFEARAIYRLSREWALDFGARESARGTHLSIHPFEFSQGETWGFFGVSYALDVRTGAGAGY